MIFYRSFSFVVIANLKIMILCLEGYISHSVLYLSPSADSTECQGGKLRESSASLCSCILSWLSWITLDWKKPLLLHYMY